ncbi:hypothetical protein Drose_03370 [Dactylosporangium roseum]|uniref:DUF11 domain-containing protein n=1 Tax=Dactylosporangium roseum TaxID=47989 RepID=A0ABY5Z6Q0_9ACTN|nr:hypothetical protein [Dactylosporangium roseum]UWZ37339.1 hypothetical protein Drose_03370 [Dactylosporangium roseum]
MEAPAGHPTRWRLRAGSLIVLSTVCSLVFAAPAHAEPGGGESSPPPAEVPTSAPPVTEEPTTQAPTSDAPTSGPTTQGPQLPVVVHAFKMSVSDVEVGDAYWRGDGAAELVIVVQNVGRNVGDDTVTGYYVFPSGTQATGAYGTDGCQVNNGALSFRCGLGERAVGRVVVKVNVDPGVWKLPGNGSVTASVTGAPDTTRNFAIVFKSQPPTPGIALSASQPQLPAVATPQAQTAQIQVKLRNTGAVKGFGAVELVTPAGVDLTSFPSVCRTHRKLENNRHRCEFGDVAAGKEITAGFGLTVSAEARVELPLTGTVHGYLTPVGRDTIESRADYRISAPPVAGESPLPTDAPAAPLVAPAAAGGKADDGSGGNLLSAGRLSSAPFVVGVIGLAALLGFLVVFSLRRRMRDDRDELSADEVEDVVLVPAGGVGQERMPLLAPRPPIPRALTLPRLPPGPVAGSGFRSRDELHDEDRDR